MSPKPIPSSVFVTKKLELSTDISDLWSLFVFDARFLLVLPLILDSIELPLDFRCLLPR